ESLRRQAGIPGLSAAIVGTSDILWERTFGFQNIEKPLPTRIDTPFEIDGLGQSITASLVLRCSEEGGLSLDARAGQYDAGSADGNLTLRELLSYTAGTGENAVFDYRPERWRPLGAAVAACTGKSFRASVAGQFDRFAMIDSVPGADVTSTEADPA